MEFRHGGIVDKIKGNVNHRDLIIFLIPTIIFLGYLMVFNPGIATHDSFNQLHQIASGQFTNWHPFFHTFINMLCLNVYPSTVSICVFQILVFSTMWTIICSYFRDDSIEKNNPFILQAAISVIICLIPINGLYSITLWKDILFSYFLMFLCFLAKVMIDRNGNVTYKFIIVLAVVMAFVSQLRGNGMYVILIAMIIYSIYLLMKRNLKMAALLPILAITFILLISALNVAYDVQDNEKDALMTKTCHMLADYYLHLDMDDADKAKIEKVLDNGNISKNYLKTGSDRIFLITNYKEYEKNKDTYIGLAIDYSLKNPLHCLKYLFESSPMVWDITKDKDWMGHAYYMNKRSDRLQMDFKTYYIPHNFTATQSYENLSYANWGTPVLSALNSLSIDIQESEVADTLLDSPALYMYISIIILILMHAITRNREIYLMYLPNLLNIVVVFLSTPIQDNRYLYANLLVCYLLIIVLIGLRQHHDFKSELKTRISKRF
jgi:hypothetical protein